MPIHRLTPARTALLVVDVQERLASAMPPSDAIANVARLIEGARLLGVPVLVTEQYPKGLGATVPTLRDALAAFTDTPPVLEKIEFDATENAGVGAQLDRFRAHGVDSIVLTGMEAHICVFQTARGLVLRDFAVHVAGDATASRSPANLDVARGLWRDVGAIATSTETVLFDLLGRAGGDAFKAISKLVR
jgi:nicotinamidase-related amidase